MILALALMSTPRNAIILAIDGSHIPIPAPTGRDTADYYSYKRFYSAILLVIENNTGMFRWITCGAVALQACVAMRGVGGGVNRASASPRNISCPNPVGPTCAAIATSSETLLSAASLGS